MRQTIGSDARVRVKSMFAVAWIVCLPLAGLAQTPVIDLQRMADRLASKTLPQETQTYFDLPIKKLKDTVPAIKGLKEDPSQDRLPSILAGVAKTIELVLPKLPDLVSREDIYHFQSGLTGSDGGGLGNLQPWSRQFRYIILCHHLPDGSMSIEEERVDGKGHRGEVSASIGAPRSTGFTYQWLFFSAMFQPQFRFRFLGEQDKNGRKTYVLAFSQIPEKVSSPAKFQSGDKVEPFYYQGVLWVDQTSYELVALRTDLLAPLPDLHLRQLTTQLTFHAVAIHDYKEGFWLPSEVYISSDQGSGLSEESHRYSDYHLYRATTTILPPS